MKLWFIVLLLLSMNAFSQDTFYISASGNNSNNGTTPNTSWQSIASVYVQPGKTYLLKRGDTLYFNIRAINNPNSLRKVKISSYGSGNKPVISLYKRIKGTSWIKHSENIWKVNITSPANYTGFNTTDTNIGFIKVNGSIYGNKLTSANLLSSQWDFYSDSTYLYIYSSSSPSANNQQIEVSCNVNAIDINDNMDVSDISICGSGAHGISIVNGNNVILKNIDINEIGGSFLLGYRQGTTRYGNGIQFWNGGINCLIENCKVTQVYDVAFTMQGTGTFTNITFQNNYADRNEQSFETWLGSGSDGFRNCKFINNQCYNAGYGWSHNLRPDKNVGVHILTYGWEVKDTKVQDLLMEGNTFENARCGLWYWPNGYPIPPIVSKNNKVMLSCQTLIQSSDANFSIKNADQFVALTGKEVGTVFRGIKDTQTITFEAIADTIFGYCPITLNATASSGLPVEFKVLSGPAEISGNTLKTTGLGLVTVSASNAGNECYDTAPELKRSFTIKKVSIIAGN